MLTLHALQKDLRRPTRVSTPCNVVTALQHSRRLQPRLHGVHHGAVYRALRPSRSIATHHRLPCVGHICCKARVRNIFVAGAFVRKEVTVVASA